MNAIRVRYPMKECVMAVENHNDGIHYLNKLSPSQLNKAHVCQVHSTIEITKH